MPDSRVQLNGEVLSSLLDPEHVDEVVWRGWTHLEMLDHGTAFLAVGDDRPLVSERTFTIRARAMTRAQRRTARDEDEARGWPLLSRLWAGPPRVYWSVPWWQRPTALWREWRSYRDAALLQIVERDT